MAIATITLLNGTTYEAAIETLYHKDAKVHESKSNSYGSDYSYYSGYRSLRTDIKTPVVTEEASVTFVSDGSRITVPESKVLSIAVPEDYSRYDGGYLTQEEQLVKIREMWDRHDAVMKAMLRPYASETAAPRKPTARERLARWWNK